MANHEQDLLWVANPTHQNYTVVWGKRPYTVEARTKKVYPRFIAEHFAKHLADHILLQKEAAEKKETGKQVSYLNSKQHRPPVINSILVGVYQYFTQQNEDPSVATQRLIDDTNDKISDEDKALDLGDINANKALGVLEDFEDEETTLPEDTPDPLTTQGDTPGVNVEPTIPTEPATIEQQPPVGHTLEEAVTAPNSINGGQASPDDDVLERSTTPAATTEPTTPVETTKSGTPGENRSINELRQEAKKLGLKITGRETKDSLIAMIQNF